MKNKLVLSEVYICEAVSKIMDVQIRICSKNGKVENTFSGIVNEGEKSDKDTQYIEELTQIQEGKYPRIRLYEDGLLMAAIYSLKSGNVIIVGPINSSNEYISLIILLLWKISGVKMTAEEIWEHNKDSYESIVNMEKAIAEEFFTRNENESKHNPYEQELREMESIENGNEEELRRNISEVYEGKIGILAKTPLRHHQNVAIGNVTLASRAAIRGGLDVEKSFSMADIFIKNIEEMKSISEIEEYKRELKVLYARAVKAAQNSGKNSNPLIKEVKRYIFTHMHDSLQVSQIAEHFNVNADYLSHLFSVHENKTIKQYILEEKVDRSRNLLKYSNYKIQEIAFYLGFCSQSHFTKVFKSVIGMNPNDYRKEYGKRSEWKA